MRLAATREVATVANGSLAESRIINMNRSENALVSLTLKFGVDVPFSKIKLFGKAIEGFVKERPREWVALSGFRSQLIEADVGYVQYILIVQHVQSWQQFAAVSQSKADVASFCLELQKKLDIRYSPPALPVNLDLNAQPAETTPTKVPGDPTTPTTLPEGIKSLANLFETKKSR